MAPEAKGRKPANTAFKQQRLKAWQPILTPKTVLPTFFIIGVIFAPLGGLLLFASDNVSELAIDYTTCDSRAPEGSFEYMPSQLIHSSFALANTTPYETPKWRKQAFLPNITINPNKNVIWRCSIQFTIPSQLKPPVFLYYRLTNFYQNHRRYVKSFDANQLKGQAVPASTLQAGNCKPLAVTDDKYIYYPCGLIANSQFNDTFGNLLLLNQPNSSNQSEPYSFTQKGIAWPSDKQKYGKTTYDLSMIRPPPDWYNRFPNGTYTETYPPPDLANDELFQVWMRTAGLPDFRKLYGRNDKDTLKMGTYQIDIDYIFWSVRHEHR